MKALKEDIAHLLPLGYVFFPFCASTYPQATKLTGNHDNGQSISGERFQYREEQRAMDKMLRISEMGHVPSQMGGLSNIPPFLHICQTCSPQNFGISHSLTICPVGMTFISMTPLASRF